MTFSPGPTMEERTFCEVHPTVETGLRCNKCGRYMCTRCAVKTPVGYRCRQCVNKQQDAFYSATTRDYVLAAIVALVIGVPAAWICSRSLFIMIFASLPIGGFIGEIAHRVSGRRRGRYTWMIVVGAIVVAALVSAVPQVQQYLEIRAAVAEFGNAEANGMIGNVLGEALLFPLIFAVLAGGAAAARLRFGK
jgi:hypothetical protein